jgi:hypothetical protein
MVGQLLSTLVGIGQSLIDRKTSQMNIDKTWEMNKSMAQDEYQKNIDMWNRANEYNTPKAQMDRFTEAGLNPNLIYGQGSSGNTATQLPKYTAPQANFNYKPLSIAPILGMYQDFTLKQAQIDNVREQNKVIKAEAAIKEADAWNRKGINTLKARLLDQGYSLKQIELKLKGILTGEQDVLPDSYGIRGISNYIPSPAMQRSFEATVGQKEIGLARWNADIKRLQVDTEYKQKQIDFMLYDRMSKVFGNIMPKLNISKRVR